MEKIWKNHFKHRRLLFLFNTKPLLSCTSSAWFRSSQECFGSWTHQADSSPACPLARCKDFPCHSHVWVAGQPTHPRTASPWAGCSFDEPLSPRPGLVAEALWHAWAALVKKVFIMFVYQLTWVAWNCFWGCLVMRKGSFTRVKLCMWNHHRRISFLKKQIKKSASLRMRHVREFLKSNQKSNQASSSKDPVLWDMLTFQNRFTLFHVSESFHFRLEI